MKKSLPVSKKDSQAIISKTKNMMGITKKILSDNLSFHDDSWMQRLWDWADVNEIPDLDLFVWIDIERDDGQIDYEIYSKSELPDDEIQSIKYEWWEGLPRDKKTLLHFKELYFTIKDIETGIPIELFNLINLEKLIIESGLNYFPYPYRNNTSKVHTFLEIPKEIGKLKNLVELVLENNGVQSLPNEIEKLSSLKILNLSRNKLEEVSSIFSLLSLESLNLSNNEISNIPKDISKLKVLETLDLSQNKLNKVPDIFDFHALKSLNLSNNEISNIPKDISKLKVLETLDLSQNKLEALPDIFNHFVFMKNLDLSGNNLTELPDNFFFTSYEYLNLSGNNLFKLPLSICDIDHIDKLIISNISENLKLKLDNDFLKLTQKQKLWLFKIEKNGATIEGYISEAEGESREYYHWMDKRIIWWDCLDVWDDFLIHPTEFLKVNIEKISFQSKGNIDIKDDFLAWADEETGLMWEVQHSHNINDEYLWKESFNYASKLNTENYAGFHDWIIPNVAMLSSILKYNETIVPVSNIHHYWSSYPFTYVDYGGSQNKVAQYDGNTNELRKIRNEKMSNVICVRIFDIDKALLFAIKHKLTDTRKILLDSGAEIDIAKKSGHYHGSRK